MGGGGTWGLGTSPRSLQASACAQGERAQVPHQRSGERESRKGHRTVLPLSIPPSFQGEGGVPGGEGTFPDAVWVGPQAGGEGRSGRRSSERPPCSQVAVMVIRAVSLAPAGSTGPRCPGSNTQRQPCEVTAIPIGSTEVTSSQCTRPSLRQGLMPYT